MVGVEILKIIFMNNVRDDFGKVCSKFILSYIQLGISIKLDDEIFINLWEGTSNSINIIKI